MTSAGKVSTISLTVGAGLLFALAACKDGSLSNQSGPKPAASVQGWNNDQRVAWYQATQGSRLLPWAWAQVLEQKDNDQLFFDQNNMAKFRFLPLAESAASPKLPIGFAIDQQDDSKLTFTKLRWYAQQPGNEKWVGLNCSACHTGQMEFAGKAITVDGAPSLVDFQLFIQEIDAALSATLNDAAKLDRFSAKVLTGKDSPANRGLLKAELTKLVAWETANAQLNANNVSPGFGRLDAVGHIFNKVAQLAAYDPDKSLKLPPAKPNPSDAPVSYPFLWDIYRQSQLQWDGIVKTQRLNIGQGYLDYGALGRNVGEVVGVFGDVDLRKASRMEKTGYNSSIQASNLNSLEEVLRKLEPPKWPGQLDQGKVAQGKTLYESKGCIGCHTMVPAGTDIFQIHMTPLTGSPTSPNRNNTDPWMACNALTYASNAGNLQGVPSSYIKGTPLPAQAQLSDMLATTVIGTLIGKWQQLAATAVDIFFGVQPLPRVIKAGDQQTPQMKRDARLAQCYNAKSPLFAYKARPLDGVWATAPYLHNGSVPTLYDLLRAPADRPKTFNVGTRNYDPAKGGYVTDASAPGNSFTFNAVGNGNSNEGHDYNVGNLTEPERLALLEYLKSL
ncbi:MAG TPA: di-heme-cytochrome C peroxidase [Allosphingosinicella sp.]